MNISTKLGKGSLAQTDQPLFEFRFSVIDSSAINVFATPGGYASINKGIMTIIDTESELAGVIAHEIAISISSACSSND